MFKWYEKAGKCYTYLKDVSEPLDTSKGKSQFNNARWFTRGWCLQELLASNEIDFLDVNWNVLGTKSSLASFIEEKTGIKNLTNWRDACIAVKFSWAARRETKVKEDIAYSLLGIFGVNLVPIYGEGSGKAFQRLQHEILQHSDDESIFAWSNSKNDLGWGQGFLASSPTAFQNSGDVMPVTVLPKKYLKLREHRNTPLAHRHRSIYTMTNKGLEMKVPIIQWRISAKDPIARCPSKILKEIFLVPIFCTTSKSPSQNWIGIMVRRVRGLVYARIGIRLLENEEQAYFMGNKIPYWSKTLYGQWLHYRADFGQLSRAPWTVLYSEQYREDDGPFKDRQKIACDGYEGIGPLTTTKPSWLESHFGRSKTSMR